MMLSYSLVKSTHGGGLTWWPKELHVEGWRTNPVIGYP